MIVDVTAIVSETISGIIVGVVLAVLGYVFLERYTKSIAFAEKMSGYGFASVSVNRQTRKEVEQMCAQATLIKIINVSGFHFLNENRSALLRALRRNCDVRFLCADPSSVFLTDIERMERNTFGSDGLPLRGRDSFIGDEVRQLTQEYMREGMTIRHFSSEYRLPFVIAHFPDGSVKAWLTMTLPPYKSTKSFVLRGELSAEEEYSTDINFIDMMEANFDTIWEYGSHKPEAVELER